MPSPFWAWLSIESQSNWADLSMVDLFRDAQYVRAGTGLCAADSWKMEIKAKTVHLRGRAQLSLRCLLCPVPAEMKLRCASPFEKGGWMEFIFPALVSCSFIVLVSISCYTAHFSTGWMTFLSHCVSVNHKPFHSKSQNMFFQSVWSVFWISSIHCHSEVMRCLSSKYRLIFFLVFRWHHYHILQL